MNGCRADAEGLIQHRRSKPSFNVVDVREVTLNLDIVRQRRKRLESVHPFVPEV